MARKFLLPRILAVAAACSIGLTTLSDTASADHLNTEVKVMSWNIAGGSCASHVDPGVMAARIKELRDRHNVDVFGLQEVHKDQAQRIATDLGYNYFFNMYFVPTSCNGTRGNAIISRNTIEDRFFLEFSASAQSSEETEKRNALGVKIFRDGRRVFVFTTHLTVKSGEDTGSAPIRAKQAIEARQFAERYNTYPFRAIFTGDFNDRPYNKDPLDDAYDAYAEMRKLYTDTWATWQATSGASDVSGYTVGPGDREKRIDYIFRRSGSKLGLISSGVLQNTTSSDHFPVLSRFSVEAAT